MVYCPHRKKSLETTSFLGPLLFPFSLAPGEGKRRGPGKEVGLESLTILGMSLQRQYFLQSYLKTLSVGPARVFESMTFPTVARH